MGYVFKPNNKQYNLNFCQKYQQIVESLMYLMIGSHSNIGFAIVKLAQQMENLLNKYYQVGLYLCKYLLNTYKYWIVHDGPSNKSIVVYLL